MAGAAEVTFPVIPTEAERSEAQWRDLFIVDRMNRSLHSASLRSG
jgi:hypothetical protein